MNMVHSVDEGQIPIPSGTTESMQIWGKMIVREIERVADQLVAINVKIAAIETTATKFEVSIAVLNAKAGAMGLLAGMIASTIIGLLFKFVFKG
jgi:hypothetical protein